MAWITRIREELAAIPDHADPVAQNFLAHYRTHTPFVVKLPTKWRAYQWTMAELKHRAGAQEVQVQTERTSDPDYEIKSGAHRAWMRFDQFVELVERDHGNSVYMTAQNSEKHRALTSILANDMQPMPAYLTDQAELAYLWLGKHTLTPLHHDVTSNLMAQIIGIKNVRMVAPEFWNRVDHRSGVHTGIDWITDELALERGLQYHDFWIRPGEALCLPCGWWHCVRSYGISITAVFTNYTWRQTGHLSFTPVG